MERIFHLLHQRHPAHDNPLGYLRTITVIGVFVFLILWIFTPFNFRQFPEDQILWLALLYAGTAYATMLVCLVWILLFPRVFAAERWTLGKEMVLVIYQFSTIAFSVWLLTRFLNGSNGQTYGYTWFIVAAGGILPYLVATSLKHIYLLRQHVNEAKQLQARLVRQRLAEADQRLSIPNLLPPLSVNAFLFAESEGNYLHIHADRSGMLQRYTVRDTLKRFQIDNASFPYLFRCHRMYIVNLMQVTRIAGNAAGYLIILRDALPPIPVSRAKASKLKLALHALTNSDKTD